MFTNKIPQHTQELLGLLIKCTPQGSYLAGGTALALHLNHRASYDLDIYVQQKFEESIQVQRFSQSLPDFSLVSTGWQTVTGKSKDTDVTLFYYEYPHLNDPEMFLNFPIASIPDIAAMKLEAISGRGLKRDFYDLYRICQHQNYTLAQVIDLANNKFKHENSYTPHYIKSLTYFEDAETLPERATIIEDEWELTKQFFIAQEKVVSKLYLYSRT